MLHRYKQDAAYELAGIDARIASTKRSAQNNPNRKSVSIADAVLPSLERKRAELAHNVETLPERPPRTWSPSGDNIRVCTRTTPLSEAELAELEIPAFLKR